MASIRITGALLLALTVLALGGCDSSPPVAPGFERVTIDGRDFDLELVYTEAAIEQGLKGRTSIPDNGGMLFVMRENRVQRFWMHECLVPIDIIFLDAGGRVTATHQMQVNPRREGESDAQYQDRLRREDMYSSRHAARFAIELQGGKLDELTVGEGDLIDLDLDRLKGLAR